MLSSRFNSRQLSRNLIGHVNASKWQLETTSCAPSLELKIQIDERREAEDERRRDDDDHHKRCQLSGA